MPTDPLAQISGRKPKVLLVEGEMQVVRSLTSKAVYRVKRKLGAYSCTCPAWRNQSQPVNLRTCKHIKQLLGEEYEDARLLFNATDSSSTKGAPIKDECGDGSSASDTRKSNKPVSKGKEKAADPDNSDTESESDMGMAPPPKATKQVVASHGKLEDDGDSDVDMSADDTAQLKTAPDKSKDELAEINGIKPKVWLDDGEEKEIESMSSNTVYKVKRTWDHMYCTCPAWRNQANAPVNARTCKHLKALLGEKYELARLKLKNPHGQKSAPLAKPASKSKKRKAADDEDDDIKATKKAKKSGKKKSTGDDEDEDEDEDDDEEPVASKKKNVPALLLANKWDLEKGADPTGWWISEKLDGVRVYYDGKGMMSRLGNPFSPPQWFLDKLPKDVTLDGELFSGRGDFQSTVSIVKTTNSPHWKEITFHIFDVPSKAQLPFEKRVDYLKKTFGKGGKFASDKVVVVEHEKAKSRKHVLRKLEEVERLGGEGLMLRKPESLYEGKRSGSLLKIKNFYDGEAIVTGYVPGKGRNLGVTGALKCKMESGKTFNVGTGLNDKQRKSPPKVGAIITYRFQELTRDSVPRFPSFVGEAVDKDEPKDAEIPPHRLAKLKAEKDDE